MDVVEVISSLDWGSGRPVVIGLIDVVSLARNDVGDDPELISVYISPTRYNIIRHEIKH